MPSYYPHGLYKTIPEHWLSGILGQVLITIVKSVTETTRSKQKVDKASSGRKAAAGRAAGRRSAEEAGATREKILQESISQFAENGFQVTSLRDIAARAGVTHGIIRHHFGSKNGVWEKSAERIFEHYAQQLMPLVHSEHTGENAAERFRQLVTAFITVTLEHPEYTRFIVQEMREDSDRACYCHERFMAIHASSGTLFDEVQASNPALVHFSNDTFFYTLMSLTCYHIINPVMSTGVDISTEEGRTALSTLILRILFPVNS